MVKRLSSRLSPNRRYGIIACGVILVGGATTALYFSRPKVSRDAPAYDIVLPQRTPVEDLGGWQRVSPAGSDPVFAYDDDIDEVAISVSQQPIPESFAGDVAREVKQLAEGYNATTEIDAGGTKAYIGRSARGPQSVILAKNDTLLLIKSEETISQEDWVRYINNLVDPKTEKTPTF